MAGLSEMPKGAQIVIMVVVAAIVGGLGFMFLVKPKMDENAVAQKKLEALQKENKDLEKYQTQLDDLNRQIASLQQQLAIQQKIVPDAKEADKFMHVMQDTAQSTGVEIRRYTAQPVNNKEFYAEVPFELDIDGSFYQMLSFFDKVSKLERIINV